MRTNSWLDRYHTQYSGMDFHQKFSYDNVIFGETLPWYSIYLYLQIIHSKYRASIY